MDFLYHILWKKTEHLWVLYLRKIKCQIIIYRLVWNCIGSKLIYRNIYLQVDIDAYKYIMHYLDYVPVADIPLEMLL